MRAKVLRCAEGAATLALVAWAATAHADVFSMPGGLTSLEWATVSDVGNTGQLSGGGAGGIGPDRVCGAVSYAYQIGKFEVTSGQYVEFLNAVAQSDTYGLYDPQMWTASFGCRIERGGVDGSYTYSVAADWANRPVNFVNWGDAARFVNWLTNGQPVGAQNLATTEDGSYLLEGAMTAAELIGIKREPDARYVIPDEDEWYKAAYHRPSEPGTYYPYATASFFTPSNDLINPDPGNNANFYDAGYTIQDPYWRTEVGEFENSASAYGTFDQAGNVAEWTEAILFDSWREIRGGSNFYGVDYLAANCRVAGSPDLGLNTTGFRVVAVPEPASAAGVALLLCACGRRRRRA